MRNSEMNKKPSSHGGEIILENNHGPIKVFVLRITYQFIEAKWLNKDLHFCPAQNVYNFFSGKN